MEVLFVANLILALLLPLLEPIYFTRYFKLSWLNPLTLAQTWLFPFSLLIMLPGPIIFLDQGLLNPYFQYALTVQNVLFLVHFITIVVLVQLFTKNRSLSKQLERFVSMAGPPRPERMLICSAIFLVLFVGSFFLMAASFGIVRWLANPRDGYLTGRSGETEWWMLCITFLSASFVLFTVYVRKTVRILWATPLYLACAYFLASKAIIVEFGVYILVILAIRQYRHIKRMTVAILAFSLALTLANFASLSKTGLSVNELVDYADLYVNAAHYYEHYLSGTIPLYHGEIAFSENWALVPRGLWPDKPHVYGMKTIVDIFYPGEVLQGSTPEFQTVKYFADFGWPQVILSGILGGPTLINAFLYAMVLPRLGRLNIRPRIAHTRMILYLFMWLAAPALIYYLPPPLDAVTFLLVIVVIEVANRLSLVSSRRVESTDRLGAHPPDADGSVTS